MGLGPPARPRSAAQGPSLGGEDAAPSGHGGQQRAPPGHREWPPESSPPRATPPRVYVEELKPTPEGDLEILLQKRWVSPHSTWNSPSPGGCGVCETRAQGMGGTRLRGPRPLGAWPRAMGQKGHHTEWPWGWCGERPVCRMLGIRAWAAAARSPVCPREVGQRLEEF